MAEMKWRTRGRPPFGMWVAIPLVYPFASLMFRLRYRHAERLPARGPVLLVANHVSILDPIACARLVFDTGRLPHFLAKQSVFKGVIGTLLKSAAESGAPSRMRARSAERSTGSPTR